MNPKAITKAESRLRVCQKALVALGQCKTYNEFTDVWYTFLTAAKGIYTTLEQGAKTSPQSRQWFGAKARERRSDGLLQYVYQARDDEEHGIEPGSELVPGYTAIGKTAPGFSSKIRVDTGSRGEMHVASLDGKPVLIEQVFPHVQLITVRGRDGKLYLPPEGHLGQPLEDKSPGSVAQLTIAYLIALLEEAKRLA